MFNRFTAFRFLRRVGHRRLFWLGLPISLYLWAIPGPFVFDDLYLALRTERYVAGDSDRLELFRFAPTQSDWERMRSRGTYPWWSPPERRIDFFRPLAERSFWLDHRLFGRNPVPPRIESLLLFAIALICVNRLYRAAEPDATRAGVATALLGVSQCLAMPVAFLSNRSDLFVLIGVSLTATAYLRRETSREILWGAVGMAGFLLALLSKEPAVAVAGVIVAHWFIVRLFGLSENRAPRRTKFVVAVFVIAATYLVWYFQTRPAVVAPLGANGHLADAIRRHLETLALYAAVWSAGLPIHALVHFDRIFLISAVAVGAVGCAAIVWVVARQLRERRPGAGFFALWMIAFLLPALLTVPEPRALSIATVGWAFLLTGLLMPYVPPVNDRTLVWTRQWFLAVNGIVSVCSGLGTIYLMNTIERTARTRLAAIADSLQPPLRDGDTLLILTAESPYELICAGGRLSWVTGRDDVSAIFLTLAGADARIEKLSAGDWLVRGRPPSLFDSPTHQLTLGPDYRPQIGDAFVLKQLTMTVAELDDEGRVTALRVRRNPGIDAERIRLFTGGAASP